MERLVNPASPQLNGEEVTYNNERSPSCFKIESLESSSRPSDKFWGGSCSNAFLPWKNKEQEKLMLCFFIVVLKWCMHEYKHCYTKDSLVIINSKLIFI